MTRITRNPPPSNTGRIGGGSTPIRAMYGIVIRDQVATFRRGIQSTLDQTKKAIADGDGRRKEIAGDGILQGSEVKKAKAAVKDLEKAIKALKPVFGGLGGGSSVGSGSSGSTGTSRPGGGFVALYGVVFRDDLSNFRTGINNSVREIRAAINNGQLKGDAKTEANKAIKYLEAAVKDLGAASRSWG